MTSTAARCRKSFDNKTVERGRQYYRSGAVTLLRTDGDSITALVKGSQPHDYRVEIDWSRALAGDLAAFCDCPRFADGVLCKHVWATLLKVDSENGVSDPLSTGNDEEDDFDDDVGRVQIELDPLLEAPPPGKPWERQLKAVEEAADQSVPELVVGPLNTKQRIVWYIINVELSRRHNQLLVEFGLSETKKDGEFGKTKQFSIRREQIETLTHKADRELLELLLSDNVSADTYPPSHRIDSWSNYRCCTLHSATYELFLERMAATGRLAWRPDESVSLSDARSLRWDGETRWQFQLDALQDDEQEQWELRGRFVREKESVKLDQPVLVMPDGLVLFADRVGRFETHTASPWVQALQEQAPVRIPYEDRSAFLQWLWRSPQLPDITWPKNLRPKQVDVAPQGHIVIKSDRRSHRSDYLFGEVGFAYDEMVFALDDVQQGWYDAQQDVAGWRNEEAERELLTQLIDLGVRPQGKSSYFSADIQFHQKHFTRIVRGLTASGWKVLSRGQLIRQPGAFDLNVTSNVDWFELQGQVDFGGITATLPSLLSALRTGQRFIELDDGSQGMLPDEWLARYGGLARLAESDGDTLRFASSQTLLLDALLAEQTNVQLDSRFLQFRDKLRQIDGIQPEHEPAGFQGELREYQREGLGWLRFLHEFRLGGCLADDMGLGKTVQVLALLQWHKTTGSATKKPSLVVVPKSLIFNWMEEAARFTPDLRVADYTGNDRGERLKKLDSCDLLLTTYGTLRRDIVRLKGIEFEFAILDESQAIKNHRSQAAKACRLLKAEHRLAMTGTPVENHLGELWSLFEFLNPGMLGRTREFEALARTKPSGDQEEVQLLARALRPFILRRTKREVLSELPEKTEQTLYCEFSSEERHEYNELRDYYRTLLSGKVESVGLSKSKMHVLEALLRLRQAACHPGLLDPEKHEQPSAKLESLLENLDEILDEGHKALVFSQFTSLLSIVRHHLDQRQWTYEYLDGRTRKRGERVKRFQEDADCRLFLISLKAGGHGLNLTAADYVFILDPWWNPAVEAQAIDRAHRIGQTRRVFAYRLIARDTVEEKILELQKSKRELADAILTGNNSMLANLTLDDLQLLLS